MADLYFNLVTSVPSQKEGEFSKLTQNDKTRVAAEVAATVREADKNPSLSIVKDELQKEGLLGKINKLTPEARAKLHFVTDTAELSGNDMTGGLMSRAKEYFKDGAIDTKKVDEDFNKKVNLEKEITAKSLPQISTAQSTSKPSPGYGTSQKYIDQHNFEK